MWRGVGIRGRCRAALPAAGDARKTHRRSPARRGRRPARAPRAARRRTHRREAAARTEALAVWTSRAAAGSACRPVTDSGAGAGYRVGYGTDAAPSLTSARRGIIGAAGRSCDCLGKCQSSDGPVAAAAEQNTRPVNPAPPACRASRMHRSTSCARREAPAACTRARASRSQGACKRPRGVGRGGGGSWAGGFVSVGECRAETAVRHRGTLLLPLNVVLRGTAGITRVLRVRRSTTGD
jgi:hypothetical protein